MCGRPFPYTFDLTVSRRDAARPQYPSIPAAGGRQTLGARHLVEDKRIPPTAASSLTADVRNKQPAKEALP